MLGPGGVPRTPKLPRLERTALVKDRYCTTLRADPSRRSGFAPRPRPNFASPSEVARGGTLEAHVQLRWRSNVLRLRKASMSETKCLWLFIQSRGAAHSAG